MRVVIADDEAPARARLQRLLAECEAEVVAEAEDGSAAVAAAEALRPDVVLLDIRMPDMDGLEAAERLACLECPPAVVFTTAYEQHALAAFEAAAVDYLLKPVRRERLERALMRAAGRSGAASGRGEYLRVYQRGGLQLLPFADVLYFRADHKYVTVHHLHGEALLESSLKALELRFGERLVRIHRNALVVRERLLGTERLGGVHHAILEGSDERPEISRRHAAAVKTLLRAVSV